MKKTKHIISWTIWSLLALYVAIVVLIHIPAAQHWIGSTVANAVAQKLGTEVSVGRVELGLFNRIIINDVVIKDLQQQDMLRARRLSVKMELLPLLDGRVSISSAQLFGAEAYLYRDSAEAVPNYQFAIDALSSKEQQEPSRLDLRIGSLIVRQLALNYDQLDAPLTPGRFNPRHLKITDVSAHVVLRALNPDEMNLLVKRISFHEHSGLELRQLAFKMEGNRQAALLSDFLMEMPNSRFSIDSIKATYLLDSLSSTLSYSTDRLAANIALEDFTCVLPRQVPSDHTFTLSTSFRGTLHSIDCPDLRISTPDEAFTLHATGSLAPDSWHTDISQLTISEQLLDELGKILPTFPQLTRLGNVNLTGNIHCTPGGDINAFGKARTGLGLLSLNGAVRNGGEQWNAHIETDSLNLQRLLDNPAFGLLAAQLDFSARHSVVNVKGVAPLFDLKGYSYHDLLLDGTYTAHDISGKLKIDDPNMRADIEGAVSTASSAPHIRVTGVIGSITPQAIHLSDRWGDANFSAIVDADFTASSLANAEGTIDLDDFTMTRNDTTHYHLDNLHIKSGYADDRHFLRLDSDFGEVLLNGQFNWNTLPQSFAAIVPMLSKGKKLADNDFNLVMRLTDSHWMQELLGIELELEGPLSLDAQVCDSCRQIEVSTRVPSFSYGTGSYRNANLHLITLGDSSQCNMQLERLTKNGDPMNIKLSAHSSGNQLTSSLKLNTAHEGGGSINTITQIYNNDAGVREVHVRVMPSELIMKGMVWELEPCDILYSEKRLTVDQFTLHHEDEHLIIDGIASTRQNDSLMIDLRGIDVGSVLDMVNFHAVSFNGKATGKAYICQAFSAPDAWADIAVDDFLFQQAPMGRLEAHAQWNDDEGQVDLDAAIDSSAEEQTYIDGFISPRRQEIDLGIRARGTSIAFLHSFTNSFMNAIEGQAYGDIRVFGPLSNIDLSGEAAVRGLASVKPLGTTYTFHDDTVRLSPGTIAFRDFHLYDRDQHEGLLNGNISHTNLKNIAFDLKASASNLLAYDFPQMDDGATIGGTVWANGEAIMRGRPGEVTIDCDVTPAPSSVFIYNAANPNAVANQQFITWGTSDTPTAENTLADMPAPQPAHDPHQLSDLRLNLRINATPDATLRLIMDQHSGDFITLNGNGALRAAYYNKGAFQMFGTYNVERGTYSMTIQNILKKNFLFQPGSTLVFGGDPLQAALNLKALHTVNGVSLSDLGLGNSFTNNTIRVNCLMNILGTAGEPRVEFDLEMPTVNSEEEQMIRSIMASEQELNQQVVYLLGIGRFYTQGANNAATQSYGQTELAMQSLLSGTVSSQINQLLSQVIKNDDWNFGANISTGNEGWHNAEYEGLISGRMLNNRLLINGQFGYRDNATQASPSFIGDFDIQYLLTPGGSLALKAYNQTNDRYFTHSSLNTQGIGIIMKKDFNGLRDLFAPRRKK